MNVNGLEDQSKFASDSTEYCPKSNRVVHAQNVFDVIIICLDDGSKLVLQCWW